MAVGVHSILAVIRVKAGQRAAETNIHQAVIIVTLRVFALGLDTKREEKHYFLLQDKSAINHTGCATCGLK